jgi:hypothetical protein
MRDGSIVESKENRGIRGVFRHYPGQTLADCGEIDCVRA